jgi:hypothetical protein
LFALILHVRRIESEHLLWYFITVEGIGQGLPCMHGW